ncbi:hypothetical protein [Marinobacterium sedimentorum]|uniref:hypothetical protein n=1 Tax=Marinobacterium sedimentorum TaxID=2927804 RepID=UPI0020C5F1E0|nr:hypothetical protein [Marinobacterium sedimentorum]MCP8690338.1 hypothetical protein [Marinobacterium sedimentorum]
MYKTKRWTAEQLVKMNEESFLVEALDMIRLSPELSDGSNAIDAMKSKLDALEAALGIRLDGLQD